jgi:hypothetical protein
MEYFLRKQFVHTIHYLTTTNFWVYAFIWSFIYIYIVMLDPKSLFMTHSFK